MSRVVRSRKSTSKQRQRRNLARDRRDEAILAYLRTARELAREGAGGPVHPLSVYTSEMFPLVFQIVEKTQRDGRIRYLYNSAPMPKWNDLTTRFKVELFLLLCEEWDGILYTFNPHIHPELLDELEGRDVVSELRQRAKRRLDALGDFPRYHFFVVEAHGKDGAARRPHIHGMAAVENPRQAIELKRAMGKVAGQDVKGRGKILKGNHSRRYKFIPEKSWAGYILKNVDRRPLDSTRRAFVFSRPAVQITREFYNIITGQKR